MLGFILFSPILVLMKLHLYDNGKSKQQLFSYFFRGMPYEQFSQYGREFASYVDTIKRDDTLGKIKALWKPGCIVYVVSASIEEWVRPWCEKQGFEVIGTQVEIDEKGLLTGRFSTKNCYGQEKVNRLLEVEPAREDYVLYAFGDSNGDKALLSFADKGERV